MSLVLDCSSLDHDSEADTPTIRIPVKMSLTLYHTKADGTQVPMKVSIWDAFKGVPNRKPREPKPVDVGVEAQLVCEQMLTLQCLCCGKTHCLKPKPDAKYGKKTNDKRGGKDNGTAKNDDNLTDDDRIILRMKGENIETKWGDILAVTSSWSNVEDIKDRFREIRHRLEDADNKEDSKSSKKDKKEDANSSKKDKKQGKQGKQGNMSEIARQKMEAGLKKKAENEAKIAAEKAKAGGATKKVLKSYPALSTKSY